MNYTEHSMLMRAMSRPGLNKGQISTLLMIGKHFTKKGGVLDDWMIRFLSAVNSGQEYLGSQADEPQEVSQEEMNEMIEALVGLITPL